MIRKIGVIYQDRNSIGFIQGLRDRLKCDAELVEQPAAIGVQQRLTRKSARQVWRYFQANGVDLIVRFTDADRDRWQEVARDERATFPDAAHAVLVCGIAVNNPEDWLALDAGYLSETLGVPAQELKDPTRRTGLVKHSLPKLARGGDGKSEVVARIVRDAPHEVFRRWLDDDALRAFYADCRAAATAANCAPPNELDSPA